MQKIFFFTSLFPQHHLIALELSVTCGVSELPVFHILGVASPYLPFDVWDPEDFVLKVPHSFLFRKPLWGECLDLWTFLWKGHLSLMSEVPSFPGSDSNRATCFPNTWLPHSRSLCSFLFTVKKHPLWRNLGLSTPPSYAAVISTNANSHLEWGHIP